VLVASVTSQPLLALLSQLPKPLRQLLTRHVLLAHSGVAFAVVHTLPQKPQLVSELVMSVSQVTPRSPSHSARPLAQVDAWQLPSTQICPFVPQARVHDPQRIGSLAVLASQPFVGSPSQSV
jgi:hypothetical protein